MGKKKFPTFEKVLDARHQGITSREMIQAEVSRWENLAALSDKKYQEVRSKGDKDAMNHWAAVNAFAEWQANTVGTVMENICSVYGLMNYGVDNGSGIS